ncbi:MAG: hypothetical protein AAB543_02475, partial [Pseudomonadota bacterium]
MTKRILLLACTLLLGGCALPVPVQIASWAVDGLLYITTEKTMADHGVSLVAQKDCAMLRVVTEGALCRDDDAQTLVASADVPAQAPTQTPMQDDDMVLHLAAFETAAGGEAAVKPPEAARPERVSKDLSIHWQTIRDVALFIEGLIEPGPSEALSDPMPEWTANTPTAPEDVGWAIRGFDVGLLLIDGDARPYAGGANAPAVWGGAGEDTLRGEADRDARVYARGAQDSRTCARRAQDSRACARRAHDQSPAPVRESLRLRDGPGHARRRPPRRGPTPTRGRA